MTLLHFNASDGARLAYRDEGGGLPVLCLAGLTRSGTDFDFVAPHLSDVRLIRADYRGRGGSEWTGAATYTIPREAQDALELLDHLGIEQAAILGTSRGGLIGLALAATAKSRLLGLCLNDVGPVVEREGLDTIKGYLGRNPTAKTFDELVAKLPHAMPGFDLPEARWRAFAERLYTETGDGLHNRYDPELRTSFLSTFDAPPADLWPLFDACADLPLALVRGENSNLLSAETAAEMRRRRPDMNFADVPGRGHVPFLDEPEALTAVRAWLERIA
ncbi:2-(acetamidomethylene)succinate hydrolase [Defluviimonas aquaemixtae]|uniref:2-(Acetamidomethylene)succinate hydrolase n=1 Tax=Albidovulum aquaemixtae TaxID=1542388 RepID=A0A2R8BLB4_9RHOB|nr:alpha/beta hydrolase [Defluviimonas aquaemixtae]SPH24186.1 2-(acetamidomethylene)succinate hydrolase [Defluviimonas aquaemixtae]